MIIHIFRSTVIMKWHRNHNFIEFDNRLPEGVNQCEVGGHSAQRKPQESGMNARQSPFKGIATAYEGNRLSLRVLKSRPTKIKSSYCYLSIKNTANPGIGLG